jgi:hypothetical protein
VGGGVTYLAQRADREERSQAELRAATAGCLYALDALHIEINLLPPSSRADGWLNRLVERHLPSLDWLARIVNRHTLGRAGMRAVDRFMLAANRLTLVAPELLLRELAPITELLGRVEDRSPAWEQEWSRLRQNLQRAARHVLDN